MLGHTSKLVEAAFGEALKRLDAVDMGCSLYEPVVAMVDEIMTVKPHIHQAIIPTLPIGIDHRGKVNFDANNVLQGLFRAGRHNFRVYLSAAFEQAEDNRFTTRSPAPFAAHPAWAEVRFVQFQGPTQLDWHGAELVEAAAQKQVQVVDRTHTQTCRPSRVRGR